MVFGVRREAQPLCEEVVGELENYIEALKVSEETDRPVEFQSRLKWAGSHLECLFAAAKYLVTSFVENEMKHKIG